MESRAETNGMNTWIIHLLKMDEQIVYSGRSIYSNKTVTQPNRAFTFV